MTRASDPKACVWVRDRLPLLAATDADPLAPGSEVESTLALEDRQAVEAHLRGCDECRARRRGLARAHHALSVAAAEPPIPRDVPSLWPALQARIQSAEAEARPRRAGAARGRTRGPLERVAGRAASVCDDLPLQLAWARDTARLEAPDRLRRWFDPDRAAVACDRLLHPAAGLAGALAAAALIAAVVGHSLAQGSRDESESRIAAALAPLPQSAASRGETVPLVVTPPRAEAIRVLASGADDLAVLDERSLARNTLPPADEFDGRGDDVDQPARTASAPPTTAVHFDLDRGVPMPPDARVGKPAY